MKFEHEISEKDKYSDGSLHYNNPLRPWHLHQLARFHAVSRALSNVTVKTLMDVGCGYGDFFYYYVTNNFMLDKYSAIDLNPEFAEKTRQRLSDDGFGGILGSFDGVPLLEHFSSDDTEKHDANVCIGAFSAQAEDGLENLEASLAAMFSKCNYATVFTVMTKKYPNDDELSIPLDWLIPVMEKHTERIYVDRSTLPHVAVCGMYRE